MRRIEVLSRSAGSACGVTRCRPRFVRNAQMAMNAGQGNLALYIEDDRQQRAGLFLRDAGSSPACRTSPVGDDARANPPSTGDVPSAGPRKGNASISPTLVAANSPPVSGWSPIRDSEAPAPAESRDLGWMLYDMDFAAVNDPKPLFFRADLIHRPDTSAGDGVRSRKAPHDYYQRKAADPDPVRRLPPFGWKTRKFSSSS